MKPRNFFRYTFSARASLILGLIKVCSALAAWGCYVILPVPVNHWFAIATGGSFVIFCSLFLIFNFFKWRKYVDATTAWERSQRQSSNHG